MSVATLSLLFVACFFVTLLAGLPLAFSTGAVAVFFAYFLFGEPGLTLTISAHEMITATARPPRSRPDQTCTARKICSAIPARSRMHAMKMNNGTETST